MSVGDGPKNHQTACAHAQARSISKDCDAKSDEFPPLSPSAHTLHHRKARALFEVALTSLPLPSVPAFARHPTKGPIMKSFSKTALLASLAGALLCGAAGTASAADIMRIAEERPNAPFVAIAAVPPGFTTYYISGSVAKPMTPAMNGKPANWGDTAYQTKSALDNLTATMAKAGLTFGDVVQAHVFMAPDPSKGGTMDFMGMNKVWLTYFGTPKQPNKPARAAFKVGALAGPGALLEIEFIAAKKK
jgi:enamine deaminase RidA (YjgF/YER057c/UK114 family)